MTNKKKSININFKGILKVGVLLIIFLSSNTIKPEMSNNKVLGNQTNMGEITHF